jgi:hypothetical protein
MMNDIVTLDKQAFERLMEYAQRARTELKEGRLQGCDDSIATVQLLLRNAEVKSKS